MKSTTQIKISILLLVVVVNIGNVYSQEVIRLKKGSINVIRIPDTSQAIAADLFIPSTFSTQLSWPLLVHVNRIDEDRRNFKNWRGLYEELGFIVISIQVSHTQELKEQLRLIRHSLVYLSKQVSVQRYQMYSIGKGRNAELSSLLPLIFPFIKGTVAIEDTYNFRKIKKFKNRFYFTGISDKKQYTLTDFEQIRKYLKQNRITAEVFEKDSNLAGELTAIKKALNFFRIKEMTRKRIQKDSLWIKRQFDESYTAAIQFINDKNFLEGYNELRQIESTFRFIYNVDTVKNELNRIKKLPKYRKQKGIFNTEIFQEQQWRNTLLSALTEDLQVKAFYNLTWWEREMKNLHKAKTQKKNIDNSWVLRVENFLTTLLQMSKSNVKIDDKERKLLIAMIENKVNPVKTDSYLEIISYLAYLQDYNTALLYLEKLLQTGYDDFDSLYEIEHTLSLKIRPDYNELVKKHLGRSKYEMYK